MSRIYWDSCVVIYRVQGVAPWSRRIATRLDPHIDQVRIYITPLIRLECRVFPIRHGDMPLLYQSHTDFSLTLPGATVSKIL